MAASVVGLLEVLADAEIGIATDLMAAGVAELNPVLEGAAAHALAAAIASQPFIAAAAAGVAANIAARSAAMGVITTLIAAQAASRASVTATAAAL